MKQENTIFLRAFISQEFSKKQITIINIISVVVASLVLWVSAKLQVPFYPVPLTFQTLVVLIIGGVFGWKIGLSALSFYMLLLGLPVFAGTPEKGLN